MVMVFGKLGALHQLACGGLLALATGACNQTPSEPEVERSAQSLAAVPGAIGYAHSAAHSRFALGTSVAYKSEFGIQKTVGPNGVFGVFASQMALAVPNADAPTKSRPPLPGGPLAHNDATRLYFVGAGLPAEQIEKVSEYASVIASGTSFTNPEDVVPTVDFFYSYISRRVGKSSVPVRDSYAWARINADRDVVAESVYWPELAPSVVAEAEAFAALLADAPARDVLLAKVGGHVRMPEHGTLVVRHTPGEWQGSVVASVSYDVFEGNRVVHFDKTGATFKLPHEALPAGNRPEERAK